VYYIANVGGFGEFGEILIWNIRCLTNKVNNRITGCLFLREQTKRIITNQWLK